MKKILLSALCVFSFVTANAGGLVKENAPSTTGCNYLENIHLQGPYGTHIMNASSEALEVRIVSDIDFQIIGYCASGRHDGDVLVRIGTDDNHYVDLTIHDGQILWDPIVTNINSVGGFNYNGIDTIYSHTYTLRFSQA